MTIVVTYSAYKFNDKLITHRVKSTCDLSIRVELIRSLFLKSNVVNRSILFLKFIKERESIYVKLL